MRRDKHTNTVNVVKGKQGFQERTRCESDTRLTQPDGDDRASLCAEASDPNITPARLISLLKDADVYVRENAIENPNVTTEHIDIALGDESIWVRRAAIASSVITEEQLHRALDDKNPYVRSEVAMSRNATAAHFDRMADDEDSAVRAASWQGRDRQLYDLED